MKTKVKRCSRCKLLLAKTEFYKDLTRKDRTTYWCKNCQKKYRRYYFNKHRRQCKEYYVNHRQQMLEHHRKYYKDIRLKVMNKISDDKITCERCGCDDFRLLEINHKNGGGAKELKQSKGTHRFYKAILSGKRKINDLNLLCGVCNRLCYFETKYGKNLTKDWRITWK